MKVIQQFSPRFLVAAALACASTAWGVVPEPSTLLYGKVVHRAHGNEHQLTEGSLVWTLGDEDGKTYTFTAELENIGDTWSYRVSIPHQALSSGLSVDPSVVPLGVGETDYHFESITLDGYPTAILWSEVDFLSLIQNSRAETHRIDLLVSFDLQDTDGDGMPDWWEKFHGLDWQNPDGEVDSDGDGRDNLDEYLGGTDPFSDDRAPSIQTLELAAYGESNNGLWLRASDLDTAPADLVYTLVSVPGGGHLHRMTPAGVPEGPEYLLGVGDSFTQEELNEGLIAYRHTEASLTETSFELSLDDGVHEPFEAEIAVSVFPPDGDGVPGADGGEGLPSWWRDENIVFEAYWELRQNVLSGDLVQSALLYLLGRDYDWTLWDQRGRTLPVTLEASTDDSHFILGGEDDDILRGGPADDILVGGGGENRLAGGAGIDLFVVGSEGLEIIEDFSFEDDIIDLADLFAGRSGSLDDYLEVDSNGTDTEIGIDLDGDGSGHSDATIRLEGVQLVRNDLHRLWSTGQLLLGELRGLPSLTIEGWPEGALEEGHSTAELAFVRNGPNDQGLSVGLNISGNASNGNDYTQLPSALDFEAGVSEIHLLIEPIGDSQSEGEEILDLALVSSGDFVSGATTSGRIRIVDMKERFSIHAGSPTAVVGDGAASFIVRRVGPNSGSRRVYLELDGTAVEGTHYAALPDFVEFSGGDTRKYLDVEALPGGSLAESEHSETLAVSLAPDPFDEYLLGDPASASMRLLSDQAAFESWLAQEELELNAAEGGSTEEATSPRTGMRALLEYALSYGVDLTDGVDAEERERITPKLERGPDGLHFEFTKRLNDSGIEYIVECSPDMVRWHSGDEYFESVPLPAEAENAGRVRYRVLAVDSEEQCFIRVRVIRAE